MDSPKDCYAHYKEDIEKSFGQILGQNLKVATINNLAQVIEECIMASVNGAGIAPATDSGTTTTNENGEICW